MSGKQKDKKKKPEVKAVKRRRFVAGLIEGKSMRQAALGAGYSQSMADNAGQKILPGAQAEFREELAKKIPLEKLLKRIAEGLDAHETKLAQFEGKYTDTRHLVNWASRLAYAELTAKLMGYLTEKVELNANINYDDDLSALSGEQLDEIERIVESATPDASSDS